MRIHSTYQSLKRLAVLLYIYKLFDFLSLATPGEDYSVYVGSITLTSNEPVCNNITIIDDDNLEECEAFLIGFEVDTMVSGVAVVPKDVDKTIIVIVDDLIDGKLTCYIRFLPWHITVTQSRNKSPSSPGFPFLITRSTCFSIMCFHTQARFSYPRDEARHKTFSVNFCEYK